MAAGAVSSGRSAAGIRGSFAGDAASLGLFWLYSDEALDAAIVRFGGDAAFLEPSQDNYPPKTGYFGHPGKRSGDLTQYGEVLRIELDALTDAGFDATSFRNAMLGSFGFGGSYSGYVDGGTKEVLTNWVSAKKEDLEANKEMGSKIDKENHLVARAAVLCARHAGDTAAVLSALRQTHDSPWSRVWGPSVVAFVQSAFAGQSLDEAVEAAIAAAPDASAAIKEAALQGMGYDELRGDGVDVGGKDTGDFLAEAEAKVASQFDVAGILRGALAAGRADAAKGREAAADSHRAFINATGKPCPVFYTFPGAVHAIALYTTLDKEITSDTFQDAIRATVRAGGNSASRAISIGLFLASAQPGVEAAFFDRVNNAATLNTLIEKATSGSSA